MKILEYFLKMYPKLACNNIVFSISDSFWRSVNKNMMPSFLPLPFPPCLPYFLLCFLPYFNTYCLPSDLL